MDKEKRTKVGGEIMGLLCPLVYEMIEKRGPMPVMEALVWLASLIATESDVPIEDFLHTARKCYQFNESTPMPLDEEQIH